VAVQVTDFLLDYLGPISGVQPASYPKVTYCLFSS